MDHDYYLFLPWLQKTIMIPKDFVFDGASVPRIFWPIIDPVGVLLIGSLFHDFGYGYNHFLDESGKIIYEGAGRSFFDDQIRKINLYINEPVILNDIVWFVLVLSGFGGSSLDCSSLNLGKTFSSLSSESCAIIEITQIRVSSNVKIFIIFFHKIQ